MSNDFMKLIGSSVKPSQKSKIKKPSAQREALKYEIADELGLLTKIQDGGWKALTAQESGRIGGILSLREKIQNEIQNQDQIQNQDT